MSMNWKRIYDFRRPSREKTPLEVYTEELDRMEPYAPVHEETLGNELSRDLATTVPVAVDGKPFDPNKLSNNLPYHVNNSDVIAGDVHVLVMDKIPPELREHALPEDTLDLSNVPTQIFLEDRLGEGIRKRYGEKRYELWRQNIDRAKAMDDRLKASNARLSAKQASPHYPSELKNKGPESIPGVVKVTITEPGGLPQVFDLKPRQTFWQRVKGWFKK